MRIIIFLATGIFIISTLSFYKKQPESKIDSFKWLVGSWTMKKKNGSSIMENWQHLNDSTLGGESLNFSMTGQSKVLENLTLAYQSGTYYYISKVNGQNNNESVKFKITSHSEKEFVAENPEHDFPKRITYQLINKDSIHAFIDGGPAMPDKKSDFYYSRYKN
jgi:hypothetical protein